MAFGHLFGLVLILHRPLLLMVGRRVAIHFAAKENLKLDCRLEGSVFTRLVIRNLRVVPTGPTIVESIDADYIAADYSLLQWWRNGPTKLLDNVEARNVTAVLNPAKASLKPKIPDPNERITLPAIFPENVRITGLNLLVRAPESARDFVLEDFNLALNSAGPGELRIRKLQVPSLPPWTNLSAKTSYTNKNLVISDLVLDDANRIGLLEVDASRIAAKTMAVKLDSALAGGTFSGSATLSETGKTLAVKAQVLADNISLDTLRGYIGR